MTINPRIPEKLILVGEIQKTKIRTRTPRTLKGRFPLSKSGPKNSFLTMKKDTFFFHITVRGRERKINEKENFY
jgi:hypothetical protein